MEGENITQDIFSIKSGGLSFGQSAFFVDDENLSQRQHELQALLRMDVHRDLSGDTAGGGDGVIL